MQKNSIIYKTLNFCLLVISENLIPVVVSVGGIKNAVVNLETSTIRISIRSRWLCHVGVPGSRVCSAAWDLNRS